MKVQYGPYSPSRLDTAICPFAFFKQYGSEEARRRESNLAAERGSAVHLVLEKATKRLCKDKNATFSEAELSGWVVEALKEHPKAAEETRSILQMAKLYIMKPPKLLVEDADTELRLAVKWDGGRFAECEFDDPEAFARGRADIMLISDDMTKAVVYDHKTQPNIEDADTFQMGFYAWVISKIHPYLNEIHTVLHFARYGYYSEPYVWTKEELQLREEEILARVQLIETCSNKEQPVSHKNCQYCPHMAVCPVWERYVERLPQGGFRVKSNNLMALSDYSKAVELAELVNVMEEVVKTCKDSLRGFVKSYGTSVAIPGKVYEYRAEEEINWTKVNGAMRETVYKVFEKYGVDPRVYMSFNQTASKSIWVGDNESLVKELSEVLPRKASSEFRGWKI